MKKFLFTVFVLVFGASLFASNVLAQEKTSTPAAEIVETQPAEIKPDEYSQARVISVSEENQPSPTGADQPLQKVKLLVLSGADKGKELEVDHGSLFAITESQKVKEGEIVVLTKTQGPTGDIYYITDRYRINSLVLMFGVFFVLALILGKRKALGSIAGLALSILILIRFVIPQILAGQDPMLVSLGGALAIAVISLYMAHGLNRRTTIALVATVATLLLASVMAIFFVNLTMLSGTGSEEAIFLRMGPFGEIDLKGLLLGGIIIGALGVLDDVTTSQVAAVYEIKLANAALSRGELFKRGLRVGREHIASLINTLALAYAGASFPLLLLFNVSPEFPSWLTINSEFITEELVRTLVGSSALILAVPIATFLAAHFLTQTQVSNIVVEAVSSPKRATKTKRKTTTSRRKTSR
jgi:uncharacterized membrane protein